MLKLPLEGANTARFIREIELLGSCQTEGIVPLLDSSTGSPPWIVTPLGVPLVDWWQKFRAKAVPDEIFERARVTILGIASALAHLHGRGVIHRDVKPENAIVLSDPERVVLIDLGVAHIRDESRLTEVDGRAVKNNFATPPQAFYGKVENPTPWWDCLGLAYLWGWMIAERHRPSAPTHWKYHPMIEHALTESVRTIMASCSMEESGPTNATGFLALAQSLGLGGRKSPPAATPAAYDAAASAMVQARRDAMMRNVSKHAELTAAAPLVGTILDQICAQVTEECRRASEHDLGVIGYRNGDSGQAQVLELLEDADDIPVEWIYRVDADKPVRPFSLMLWLRYQRVMDGFLPLRLEWRAEGIPDRQTDYIIRNDGTIWVPLGMAQVPIDHVVQWVSNILTDPGTWLPQLY